MKRPDQVGERQEPKQLPHRGFILLKQHRGDRSALSRMNVRDAALYREAMFAIEQAMAAKKLLGEDTTPQRAAEIFTELADKLRTESDDLTARNQIEESIALIASIYNLRSETSGIGDVLQAARDGHETRLSAHIDHLLSARIRPIITEAFAFLDELNAIHDSRA